MKETTRTILLQFMNLLPGFVFMGTFASCHDIFMSIIVYCVFLISMEWYWRNTFEEETYWPFYFAYEWQIEPELFMRGWKYMAAGTLLMWSGLCAYFSILNYPSCKEVVFYVPFYPKVDEYYQMVYLWEAHQVWMKVMSFIEEAYYRYFMHYCLKKTWASKIVGAFFLSTGPFGIFYMQFSNKTFAYVIGTIFCIINYLLYLMTEKVGFLETLMFKQGCYLGISVFLMMVFEKASQFVMPEKVVSWDVKNVWSLLFLHIRVTDN